MSLKTCNDLHVYEYCLRGVFLFHPSFMVSKMKVKFSQKLGSMNFIQEVINN
jgi:hypothetical protein